MLKVVTVCDLLGRDIAGIFMKICEEYTINSRTFSLLHLEGNNKTQHIIFCMYLTSSGRSMYFSISIFPLFK
jgi:hypothetical protein